MIAHALTAARLLLVAPVTLALARPGYITPGELLALVCIAIVTDYADGPIARMTGTASPGGQLFDHATDCLFVTASLAGAAVAGTITPILPPLIVVAFGQYVLDSYLLYRQKELRMSVIGRWNGVLYFVPLVVVAVSRMDRLEEIAPLLATVSSGLGYALVTSTVASIVDRALAPRRLTAGQL